MRGFRPDTANLVGAAGREYSAILRVGLLCKVRFDILLLSSCIFEGFQCSMAVMEGLFPETKKHPDGRDILVDTLVQDLLFVLARWLCLAKLRLQSETTARLWRHATRELGMFVLAKL